MRCMAARRYNAVRQASLGCCDLLRQLTLPWLRPSAPADLDALLSLGLTCACNHAHARRFASHYRTYRPHDDPRPQATCRASLKQTMRNRCVRALTCLKRCSRERHTRIDGSCSALPALSCCRITSLELFRAA